MKENDSDLRVETSLDTNDKAVRRLGFADTPLIRMAKALNPTEAMLRDMALAIEKSSVFTGYSKVIQDLAAASNAFAFRNNPLFIELASNAEQMRGVFAALEPFHSVVTELGERFRSQLELHSSAISAMKVGIDQSGLKDVTARMAEIARVNFALPEIALTHWPKELILDRVPLLRDCILNNAALETLHAAVIRPDEVVSFPERLVLATDFVSEQAEIVRRLPPRVEDLQGVDECRREEISARLEIQLRDIDLRFVDLRRQAWAKLGGGVAGARLAMTGIREIFTDVLEIVAPDSKIMLLPMWENRTDRKITKPTRKMRLVYVLGEEKAALADALLQFDVSVKHTQKFVHTFAEDVHLVRAQMASLEIWIFILLHYGMKRSRSN